MVEINFEKNINILFKNSLGEVGRVSVSSDREAQQIIEQRAAMGDIAIASAPEHEASNLTEKYRLLISNEPPEPRR